MSGETEKDVSGWTVDTLRSHVASKIDALDRTVQERVGYLKDLQERHAELDLREFQSIKSEIRSHLEEAHRTHQTLLNISSERAAAMKELIQSTISSMERAIGEAKGNMETRFNQVNEWRQTYGDLARSNISSDVFDEFKKNVETQLSTFSAYIAANSGERRGVRTVWGVVTSAAVAAAAVVAIISFFVGRGIS